MKKETIKKIAELANRLDKKSLTVEADVLDKILALAEDYSKMHFKVKDISDHEVSISFLSKPGKYHGPWEDSYPDEYDEKSTDLADALGCRTVYLVQLDDVDGSDFGYLTDDGGKAAVDAAKLAMNGKLDDEHKKVLENAVSFGYENEASLMKALEEMAQEKHSDRQDDYYPE